LMKVCVETDITRYMRKNVPRRVALKDKVLARMKALGCSLSGSGLRRTPGGPHLPPSPLPLPRWRRGRGDGNLRTFPPAPAPSPNPCTFPQPPHLPPSPPSSPLVGANGRGWGWRERTLETPQWSGTRWQVTHASRRRDGKGF
jgi:hypothetical protein